MVNLPVGTRLMTLDGTIFGNAIVVSYAGEDDYFIETDFGNRLRYGINDIDQYWSYDLEEEVDLNRWYEERQRLIARDD